ncbi:MAG: two-component regulator propeller domain-containing protein [Bacteroidota bacterium]
MRRLYSYEGFPYHFDVINKIIISVFLFSVCTAQQDEYVVQQWKVEDGLPQSTVRCIAQSKDGYIWAGTWQGLARFDGIQMTVFKSSNTPELYSSNIMSLFSDSRGQLWIGTDAGGLVRYNSNGFQRFNGEQGCPAKRILYINEDRTGIIWLATEIGIFAYNGTRFLHFTAANGLPHTYANQVMPMPDGSIYLGFVGVGSIARLVHDSLVVRESFPVGGYVVAVDTAGAVWYGDRTRGFIRRYAGKDSIIQRNGTAVPGESYVMKNGNIWLLTSDHIRIFSRSGNTQLTQNDGLLFTEITIIFEDREGNIWLGKEGDGLILLRKKNVLVHSLRNGFPSDLVQSGIEDHTGTLWIGSWDAGLIKMKNPQNRGVERIPLPGGVKSVFTLYESKDSALWVGTWGFGLFRIKNGERRQINRSAITPFTSIISITEDSDGGMWIATAHEGIVYFNGTEEKVWNAGAGLSGNRVNSVLAARNGDVWATVSGSGVNRIANGKVTVYRQGSGLNDNFASPLYEDKEGSIWVGTNRGLARWKNGSFTFVTEEQGLFDGSVAQIIEDDYGYFWIGAIHGIYRVSTAELNAAADGTLSFVRCFTLGKEDGMLNEETSGGGTPRCWKRADGTLWFTTSKGIVTIDPISVASNPIPPGVMIENAWVDNEPISLTETVILQPGVSKIEIRYTGISFTAPSKIRFTYQLTGFDERWNEAGTKRFVQYTNLDPGEYQFTVRAENSAGVQNRQGAAFRIVVLPPFYRTWWFMSMIVLFFLTAGPAVYVIRVRQLQKEKDRQVEFSRRLIESQESERKRIATELHDGLGQNLLIIKNKLLVALQSFSNNTSTSAQVEEASNIVTSTIEEVRSISHNLRPHQLDQLGITKTLRSVIRQMKESTTMEVTAEIQDIDGVLTPEQEISLFRIVQESFNNIIKHSGATTVFTSILRQDQTILVVIEDNGKGITTSGGFGISGMRERSEMFAWNLSILPRNPQGTLITIIIPIHDK